MLCQGKLGVSFSLMQAGWVYTFLKPQTKLRGNKDVLRMPGSVQADRAEKSTAMQMLTLFMVCWPIDTVHSLWACFEDNMQFFEAQADIPIDECPVFAS